MKSWLATGSALLVVGLLKIWQHTSAPKTLADYLAFRCGSADSHSETFLSFAGHCWGCPVAAIGAAMIIASIGMAAIASQRPARRVAVIRKG